MKNSQELFQCEIEALTGKIYKGDVTPLIYDLLKTSPHLDKLLVYLGKEIKPNVCNNEFDTTLREEINNRPCFEKWFEQFEKL